MLARILAFLLLLAPPGAGPAPEESRVAVVVNASRAESLNADRLAEIYLKKRLFWSNGKPIVAVNRDASSEVRRRFTRVVFGDSARGLARYWNRQYLLGILPPATLASDEAVLRFVAREPDAVGYVDAQAVDGSVRAVLYLDLP